MGFLEKIFGAINHFLEIIWGAILALFFKIVPPKMVELYHLSIAKIKEWFRLAKNFILSINPKLIIQKIKQSSLKDYIDILKSILKKINDFLTWAKNFDIKKAGSIPEILDEVVDTLWKFISYPFVKFWEFLKSLTPVLMVLTIIFTVLAAMAIYYAGTNGYKLYRHFHPTESIIEEKYQKPEYYQKNDRQFTLFGVDVPVYVEKSSSIKNIRFDITIESSNRFARNFLESKKYLVLDQINQGIEPVIPSFPLTEEGRAIIKLKIRREIDLLIKKLQIKGTISEIYVDEVMAN